MNKIFKKFITYILVIAIVSFNFLPIISITKVKAEGNKISEIRIASATTSVTAGSLETYTVEVSTDHVSIQEYGSNTIWVKWPDGYSSWHGFGTDVPTAEAGDTHYGLRLLTELSDGYTFDDNVKIYFNGVDISDVGHTLLTKNTDSSGYVYIDLGTVGTHTVTFNTNEGTIVSPIENIDNLSIIDEPISPNKSNSAFTGWYLDGTLTKKFDFSIPINADNVLYAGWEDITGLTQLEIGADQNNSINNMVVSNDNTTITFTYNNNNVLRATGSGLIGEKRLGLDQNDNLKYRYYIYTNNPVTLTVYPNGNYGGSLWQNGTNLNRGTETYTVENIQAINNPRVDASFIQNNEPEQEGNTVAKIHVSAGEGTYSINRYNQETGQNVKVNENYDDMANFYINGTMWDPASTTISYNSNEQDETVDFTFETLWINRYYDDICIKSSPMTNYVCYNVDDYLDFDDRTEWLVANKGRQVISFVIPNVAKATGEDPTYDIVVKHGENNGKKYMATFLWTADPLQEYEIERNEVGDPILDASGNYKYKLDEKGNKIPGKNYIGHSKLEFVKATYKVGDTTYTLTDNDLKGHMRHEGNFDTFNSEDEFLSYGVLSGVNFDDGNLTLPGGAFVTMRVVPEYGYQVTSVNGGDNFTTTDDGVSEFTVQVGDGTAGYFLADVTEVDDEVLANSKKVKSGSVKINNGDIESGTARLSVDDVTLSKDKIKDFKEAAGDDYNIKSYLDINLSQVLYKGTSDDVWETQIHELDNEASISLQLEEGIDVNDIVIVHNIGDGEEFEVIPIESYDPDTRTITFKTKSFSNFAIATKKGTINPHTVDNIYLWFITLIVSGLCLTFGIFKFKKLN